MLGIRYYLATYGLVSKLCFIQLPFTVIYKNLVYHNIQMKYKQTLVQLERRVEGNFNWSIMIYTTSIISTFQELD